MKTTTVLLAILAVIVSATFALAAEPADTVALNGKIVHEEAVDWDPPEVMIEMNPPDFCGSCDGQDDYR